MFFSFTRQPGHFTCLGMRQRRISSTILLCFSGLIFSAYFSTAFGAAENPAAARFHTQAKNAERLGNLRAAMECEQQASGLAPQNALYMGEWARLLWESGFAEKAIRVCRAAQKLDPESSRLRFNSAVMLQSTGDPKSAIIDYEKVLKNNSADMQARLGYAQSLALAGRSQDAVSQLDILAGQAKKFPVLLTEVADTALNVDQPRRAKEMLKDLVSTGNARVLSLLYLSATRDKDEKLALSIQRRVMDSAPKDARIYFAAADYLHGNGKDDYSVAEQILAQAMKSVRNDGDLYAHLAGVFLQNFAQSKTASNQSGASRWLTLAEKALAFAEEIHVKAWRYRFAHAGVLSLQGRSVEAAEAIEELARREPKNELIQYCRGRFRSLTNNPAAAARRNLKTLMGEKQRTAVSSDPADDGIILACSRAYFEKLGCGCHTAVLELKWKRSGGVLYAKVISEQPAVGLIVHQMGDPEGFKGRIISAAASINERVMRVETETVKGLGALAINVVAPEAPEQPPLLARLHAPELQKLQ